MRESYPLLVACAQDLASHQIRNRATVDRQRGERLALRGHGARHCCASVPAP